MNSLLAFLLLLTPYLQDTREQIMEKRAREMARVMSVNDPAQWRKFVQENYSQSLIDKPMRAKVETSDNGQVVSSNSQTASNLEAKAAIFEQLHQDFGDGEIKSVKVSGNQAEMVIFSPAGLRGTFKLTFDTAKPYLITGLGIDAGN